VDDFSEGALAIGALASPSLAPLFWRPSRLGVDSAWYGHLPFAQWIVFATRPRFLVELGTHAGVSYSAFCEAVQHAQLDTRCFAVDTWAGDEHAGFYGEDIFEDFKRFHDERYAAFSQMIRLTFDEALGYVPENSIDLLHIDGRHHYEDVRHDFETWRSKLSDRAVVLFHDTNVRERDFGVWRLWQDLRGAHPSFEFLHSYGLGILAVGANAPAPVTSLCALHREADIAAIRERFALLGERWVRDVRLSRTEQDLKDIRSWGEAEQKFGRDAHADLSALTVRYQALEKAYLQLQTERHRGIIELAEARSAGEAAERRRLEVADALHAAQERLDNVVIESQRSGAAAAARIDALLGERDRLFRSRTWRVASLLGALRGRRRGVPPPPFETGPTTAIEAAPPAPDDEPITVPAVAAAPVAKRILYISGEPHTPGSIYRCERYAEASRQAGWEASTVPIKAVTDKILIGLDAVVLWRAAWDGHVEQIVDCARGQRSRIVFDVDDLMFKPELARIAIVDGIRSIQISENEAKYFFGRVGQVLQAADLCTCTTSELAQHMRESGKPTHVLPNGFDTETLRRSRLAVRRRRLEPSDGLIRLGYAAGTRTHQRDFQQAVPALARLLAERPDIRLVLFRGVEDGEAVVIPEEFAALDPYRDQIEWRDMVPLADLPDELARFDINLAPLEVGNPFCEAKSELKYYEAALVDVCTVASPTGPYRRAIDAGRTGFLAADDTAWYEALRRLVDDPALRGKVAHAAYHDTLWTFGPQRRLEMTRSFLDQLAGGAIGARAFELDIRRGNYRCAATLDVAPADVLFRQDRLEAALVTVAVASSSFTEKIIDTLESVRMQTLAQLDLVVVDDGCADATIRDLILAWVRQHAARFGRLIVLRHHETAGAGAAGNTAFDAAETDFVLKLDAMRLQPECCALLLAAVANATAAFAYAGEERFEPMGLAGGNVIDSVALMGKWAWAAAGFYDTAAEIGREEYGLWCRLAELGQFGVKLRQAVA
jgi:glycosyltransferase involved in cell wall biosynthesis